MIERIVAFALHQRFVVLALALILTVGGLVSYGHLPIEAYPDVGDVKVEIITLWPGHAAEEVERLITIPLENELNGIANVTFLRSDTLFGLSNIRVLFADGTDDYWARQQVQERLAGAELPSDAKPQLGPLSGVIGEIFRYTLESKTLPLYEVKAIQDWVLEREFKKVPGVADVVSWGGGTKQYQVVVDPGRLRAYNLTLKQVFDAVASNNSNAGSGYIAQGDYRIPVRGIGLLQSVADIESIVVAAQKGTPVRVRDIGEVAIGTAIRLGVLGRDHDDDLVQGIVLMRKGENPGQVIEGVKARAAAVQKLLPAGVELRPYYSRDRLVQTTVHTVLRNLIEGAALVVILLTLFLYDIRAALIVALTIPLSLLFAFIFMDLRGIPANLLSLGAIDFGIIVDGAVIMTENIVRRLAERRPRGARVAREVQHAAVEVARPLTFAVLIIMTVYVPILTFQRIEGKLFRPMAVTISLAVIGALVLTLTLIPVLASLLFRRPPAERESPLLRWLRRPYLPALRWCLKRPRLPVLGAAVGVVAALFVFSLLGKEFLPELDEGDLWVRTQFPIGISIEAVRPYVREIRERLLKFPEVRVVVSQLGAPDDGTDPEAPDNVEFYVGLRPREEWADPDKEKLVEAMTAALASIPGITTNFSQPIKDNVDEALAGTKGELAIKLYGPDFFVMDAKAKEIAAVLRDVRGVADLDYDHAPGQPQLQIVVDRRAAARHGINVQDIQDVTRRGAGSARPARRVRPHRRPRRDLARGQRSAHRDQVERARAGHGRPGRGGHAEGGSRGAAARGLPDGLERSLRGPATGAGAARDHRAARDLHHLRAAVRRVQLGAGRAHHHAQPAVRPDRRHPRAVPVGHELQHLGRGGLHRGLRGQRPQRGGARLLHPAGAGGRAAPARGHRARLRDPIPPDRGVRDRGRDRLPARGPLPGHRGRDPAAAGPGGHRGADLLDDPDPAGPARGVRARRGRGRARRAG